MEFHDAIRVAIPQLVELLKNEDPDVRSSATTAIGHLGENGKSLTDIIVL